jgi:hypothetical protein
MSKQLVELVLPRLARPLYLHLKRFRSGQWDEAEFTRSFEQLLKRQHAWLTKKGIAEDSAALTIHGAVLVLSSPGLKAEAQEAGLPLEVVEFRAIKEAAADVSTNYGVDERHATQVISEIVSKYNN